MGGTEMTGVEIAIEAPGSPADVLAFYDRALPAAGLTPAPTSSSGSGGFQPASAKRSDMYCLGESGPWLTMSAAEQGDGGGGVRRSDVRVSVTMRVAAFSSYPVAYAGPCSTQQPVGYSSLSTAARLLPRLSGPAGVPMQTGMGQMGLDYATTSAVATTDMSVGQLETYFAEELVTAGWTRLTAGGDGPVAWSLWTLPEEGEWQGFLTAVEAPGVNRRRLSLVVESTGAGTSVPGPVYFSYP